MSATNDHDNPRVLVMHVAASSLEPAYSEIVRALGDVCFQFFDSSQPTLDQMRGKEVVIDMGGWAKAEHVQAGAVAGVRLWQVCGYGLDHLAYDEAIAAGLQLARTPGPTTAVPLAEHAMFLLLAVEKQANAARAALEAGQFWDGDAGELAGKTLAIIGLGASGGELARRAAAFGMRVLGVDICEFTSEQLTDLGVESCVGLERLHYVLGQADAVSLHLPLVDETRHLINAEAFSAMKPGAVLINVARGPLVDEAALVTALREGTLRGAGLDVFEVEPLPLDSPLLAMPNVVLTPHWAAATRQTLIRRAEIVADNARRVLANESPRYLVVT